jgi:hypothetical protein
MKTDIKTQMESESAEKVLSEIENKRAMKRLLLACSKFRLRVIDHAPALTKFSDWDELTDAMGQLEVAIKGGENCEN